MLASSGIDLAAPARPTGAPTLARLFAQECADRLTPAEVRRFDRPLQNIEIGASSFVRGRTNALHPHCSAGAAVMDAVRNDDVLIVYADGRKRGGVAVGHPPLSALAASVSISQRLNAAQRHRKLVATAVALRPKHRPEPSNSTDEYLIDVAVDLVTVAGLLLSVQELAALAAVRGVIPAVAIVALTDTRGRPSVETRHFATTFPGRWLGTGSPAGQA